MSWCKCNEAISTYLWISRWRLSSNINTFPKPQGTNKNSTTSTSVLAGTHPTAKRSLLVLASLLSNLAYVSVIWKRDVLEETKHTTKMIAYQIVSTLIKSEFSLITISHLVSIVTMRCQHLITVPEGRGC